MSTSQMVFLLLGSNIEPRIQYLDKAMAAVQNEIGRLITTSSIYESEAIGFKSDTYFLNRIVQLETKLIPEQVMKNILQIEARLDRVRLNNFYESRTVDIDLLYFDKEIIQTDFLTIPHPRLHLRKFAMIPLAEIAGDFVHPIFNRTNKELLDLLGEEQKVWKYI